MSKKDFLQKKYEEINKLKSMLQSYPEEYKDTIVKSICKISDEVVEYLEKHQKKYKNNEADKHREPIIGDKVFTLEEIKKYDGLNGALAYVAVDGIVYDVTPIKAWLNGKHYGLKAGADLSQYFNTCHQNEKDKLKKLKVVGTIKA